MEKETYEQTSRRLDELARRLTPAELDDFFREHGEELITSPRPFADYVRRKIREKGLLQQNVFLAADLSENYGYKLIAEEKHTRRRDVIVRLCLGARFLPEEIDQALLLYGMAPLRARFPRDAVLLAAAGSLREVEDVDELLRSRGFAPLGRGE